MPVPQIISMKLLGAALLSLAVFSICTTNAQENSSMTPTSTSIQSTAVSNDSAITISSSRTVSAQENSSMTPTSTSIQSTAVSSDSTITISSSRTVSVGKTASLPERSVTVASASTSMMTDLATSIVTSEHSESHQTTSDTHGSPPAPVTTTSAPTVIKTDTITPYWKSPLTPSYGSPESNYVQAESGQYSSIILPVVIALIVITLSVFILVALYRMYRRTTQETQENGTEQAPTDKEGVKLLSVKTTSPETGEHSSQGKNRTHQPDESSSDLGNKYM